MNKLLIALGIMFLVVGVSILILKEIPSNQLPIMFILSGGLFIIVSVFLKYRRQL